MFVKNVYRPKLKRHCGIDFLPRNPKFNKGHLLVMTNHHTKSQDPWAMSSLIIDLKMFVDEATDRHICTKQYTPLL